MYISGVRVGNYKSFNESPILRLGPGFNIVAGQNSAGKTALLEALALGLHAQPHRSVKTVPMKDILPSRTSWVDIWLTIRTTEAKELLGSGQLTIVKPNLDSDFARTAGYTHEDSPEGNLKWLTAIFSREFLELQVRLDAGQGWGLTAVPACGLYRPQLAPNGLYLYQTFWIDKDGQPKLHSTSAQNVLLDFAITLAVILQQRIYRFTAERLNVSRCKHGNKTVLDQNAANLPEVLNLLQHNTSRFRRFNRHLNEIFPVVRQVSVRGLDQSQVEIVVWSHDPDSERDDLAVPLSEAGTGIGQALAILYVVLTSDRPQTIVIDEPQTFLHPGAARKLMGFLKHYPQHQYIIATHSATIIAAANPETITLVRFNQTESAVEQLDASAEKAIQATLAELGVRLSDVFGADHILWVEGRTEEKCFQIIVEKLLNRSLVATQILGIRETGDLRGRDAKKVFEIYRALANAASLLPPALAFVLDEECRSTDEKREIQKLSRGLAQFLPRRMYENYLLHPGAMAAVMNGTEGFRGTPVAPDEVQTTMRAMFNDENYYCSSGGARPVEERIKNIDGARVLGRLFCDLSETRVAYDKVAHGIALTEWMVANSPNELKEIGDFLIKILDSETGRQLN